MDSKKLSELKRRREDEDRKLTEFKKSIKKDPYGAKEKTDLTNEEILEAIQKAEGMILQIDTLYRQFMSGVESKPPHEVHKQLRDLIATITKSTKNTTSLRFRFNTLQSSLTTYQDKWDRLLKDLESGKKHRTLLRK